ncbi:hypothetical protein NY2A_b146L [Paramecium bursaria Chlorella virus NY2A]|uniref:Uncharacterized protein b146L n=1 Tax=Paramecium bursaria Chlorella virus NY2A TaxID=46021 RepID=A7IW21_PBCVN|nr:hypothetical protein NY2A_b146L [Paramecium bursaria Chlorella virus NY2A]ABT14545.1 hypothetical protein NY2A_b146L [Paramecium bursaria Chlorella virus NY2A]
MLDICMIANGHDDRCFLIDKSERPMLQLTTMKTFRMNIRNLFELQRALECYRSIQSSSKKYCRFGVMNFVCPSFHFIVRQANHSFDSLRKLVQQFVRCVRQYMRHHV